MALACYTSGMDLSRMRIEERQPFWNEVASAHSLINKFQPMNVGGFQYIGSSGSSDRLLRRVVD